jgi:hypothetical protein
MSFVDENLSKINKDESAQVGELILISKAISNSNVDEVDQILKSKKLYPRTLNKTIAEAFSQYYESAKRDIKDIILLLLKQPNADVDYQDFPKFKKDKLTILIVSGMKADIDLIKKLINFNPDVNKYDNCNKNVLMHLLYNFEGKETNDLIECVSLLIRAGIYLNAEDNLGNTALTISTTKGFNEICNLLIKLGANVNQQVKGNQNNTGLHIAIEQSNIELVSTYIKYGANLSIKNDLNKNLVEASLNSSNSEIYKLLAEESNKRAHLDDNKVKKDFKMLGVSNKIYAPNKMNSNMIEISSKSMSEITTPKTYSKDPSSFMKLNNLNSNPNNFLAVSNFEDYLSNKVSNVFKKDLKYSKIKGILENSKIEIPSISGVSKRLDKSDKAIIKKLEAELFNYKKENSLLKLENQMLKNELKIKDVLLIENKIIEQPESDNLFKKLSQTNLHEEILSKNNEGVAYFNTQQTNNNLNLINQNSYISNPELNLNTSTITPNISLNNNLNFNHLNPNNHYHSFKQPNSHFSNLLSKKEILEKKFNNSLYNNEYVLKSLHRDLLDFQEYNKDQIRKIKPIQEELLEFIKESVAETLPDFEVKLYGSHATGLCLSWSDLDTVLVHKKGMSHLTFSPSLQSLYLKLLEKPWRKSIKYIDTAVIPLIKIIASDKYNNMQIDISVQDSKHYGLKCVDLVKSYMNEFEALEPLLYSLKNLLKNANLNDPYTGGLSSYGLILMLVSFLQNQNEHGKDISVKKDSNVGRLFLEFCYYYGVVFDHNKYVINAYPLNGSDNYQDKESLNFLYVSYKIRINI